MRRTTWWLPVLPILVWACAGTSNPSDEGGPGSDVQETGDARDSPDRGQVSDDDDGEASWDTGPEKDDGGSVEGDRPDAGTEDPDPSSWCDLWAGAWCDFQARCGWRSPRALTACRRELAGECPGAWIPSLVDRGSVEFDSRAARTCLERLSTLPCGDGWRLFVEGKDPFDACRDALRGLRGPGETCSWTVECPSHARCDLSACPGTCRAFAEVEAPCDSDRPCDPLVALCREGTCVPLPRTGEECPEGICAWPLRCEEGICEEPLAPSEECVVAKGGCLAGLVCKGQGSGLGRCEFPSGPGDPCFRSSDCADPEGRIRLVCVSGRCVEAPGVGEPCPDRICTDAWCDPEGPVPLCRSLLREGDACSQEICAGDLWCRQGTCTRRLADGSPCEGPWQCLSGRCEGGTCRSADALPCS